MSILNHECEIGADECIKCSRKLRLKKVLAENPQPFYVVVYGITRHYGGPEEGGWWWDCQMVLEVKKVWTIKAALKTINQFKEDYPPPRYNRFSVLGGQDIVITLLPDLDFIQETTEKPIYE